MISPLSILPWSERYHSYTQFYITQHLATSRELSSLHPQHYDQQQAKRTINTAKKMSSTRQQRQRSASPAPPGESGSNIHVKQRGEFTYLEIKKMYSCPAKCGTESNDKSHMLRHIWVDHREEDGLNLMKQFQIDSGGKSVIPYKCYGCDKQPVFRPSALFSHFLEHINEAEEYTERLANEVLEEINAKNLTQKQKTTQSNLLRKQRLDFAGPEKIAQAKLKHEQAAQHEQYRLEQYQALFAGSTAGPSTAPPTAPAPSSSSAPATPLAPAQPHRSPRTTRCRVAGCKESFRSHEDLEAHLSTHHHTAPPSSPK